MTLDGRAAGARGAAAGKNPRDQRNARRMCAVTAVDDDPRNKRPARPTYVWRS